MPLVYLGPPIVMWCCLFLFKELDVHSLSCAQVCIRLSDPRSERVYSHQQHLAAETGDVVSNASGGPQPGACDRVRLSTSLADDVRRILFLTQRWDYAPCSI